MEVKRFPIYKYDYIFNKFNSRLVNNVKLFYESIEINYPCRLDAMAINPSAVCYNDSMVFTPGEVVISTEKFINVKVKVMDADKKLEIGENTKRKVLVKHAYALMKDVLKFDDALYIDVDDKDIPKHCGFGSSSSTIAAVAAAINELYNHPISNPDLIKYLAANHGEEVSDDNEDELKMVQCIGGGATNGLTEEGIIIIAGKSTSIAKMKYDGTVLIAVPNDFVIKDADYLMKKEEDNLWKFKKTGDLYSEKIAYDLLHKALPSMVNGSIKDLADVVFDYRFNMGSIENCSFVYEPMVDEAKTLRKLYENGDCEFLALSSVGPAYFVIVNKKKDIHKCTEVFKKLNMNVMTTKICNSLYKIMDTKLIEDKNYWEKESTASSFKNRSTSSYITNEIDKYVNKNSMCLDIGCGGGRYSRYLKQITPNVIAIDKYENMGKSLLEDSIDFKCATFDNVPLEDSLADVILSIGVIHNAETEEEYDKAFKEMNRLLKSDGTLIFSVFTNDIITSDLTNTHGNCYNIQSRPPMVLYSKEEIDNIFKNNGFEITDVIDEHITYVGDRGARYVYSVVAKKK